MIKAIGHPLRWKMLEALNEGEASPAQLARRFGEGVNLVAYHMGILAELGAAELVRTEPRRGSTEHYYVATMRPFFHDREWSRLPRETRRAVLDAEVGKIVKDVRAAAESDGLDHPRAHVSWTPLELDDEGFEEVADLLGDVLNQLLDIQSRVTERRANGEEEGDTLSTEVAVLHFERRRGRHGRPPGKKSRRR